MKNYKLNQENEITFEEAKELVKNSPAEYDFNNLNESTIDENNDFEQVQNRRFYVTKKGKKGTVLNKGSEYETKATLGIFELEMIYDFRHPTNFALNENNVSRTFIIEW